MRKFTSFFGFFIFLSFIACSNNSGDNHHSSGNDAIGSPEEGKVIHLNAEAFKKLVWDYQKNPVQGMFGQVFLEELRAFLLAFLLPLLSLHL